MTKINQTNQTVKPQKGSVSKRENGVFKPKNYSRRWIYTLPDLIKTCFICDQQIKVKYNLPRKKYSQKNNWNHWTSQETKSSKYICDTCLTKLHLGGISRWIKDKKVENFYTYFARGSFNKSTEH